MHSNLDNISRWIRKPVFQVCLSCLLTLSVHMYIEWRETSKLPIYLMYIVAKFPFGYGPRLLVMPLESCNLWSNHRCASVPIVVHPPMIHSSQEVCMRSWLSHFNRHSSLSIASWRYKTLQEVLVLLSITPASTVCKMQRRFSGFVLPENNLSWDFFQETAEKYQISSRPRLGRWFRSRNLQSFWSLRLLPQTARLWGPLSPLWCLCVPMCSSIHLSGADSFCCLLLQKLRRLNVGIINLYWCSCRAIFITACKWGFAWKVCKWGSPESLKLFSKAPTGLLTVELISLLLVEASSCTAAVGSRTSSAAAGINLSCLWQDRREVSVLALQIPSLLHAIGSGPRDEICLALLCVRHRRYARKFRDPFPCPSNWSLAYLNVLAEYGKSPVWKGCVIEALC